LSGIGLITNMKVGILLPQISEYATRENIIYIAKEAEKEGFDSVWTLDRLLWPIKPQTPYPGTPDGSLPVEYQNVFDPLATLTYVAGHTERISLGTSVIDMLFHNPVVLAKRLTTLDILSDGRVIAGFGIGWSKDEYDVSGIPFKDRGARADEFLQLLNRIWTDDIVEYTGKYYKMPASKIGPKPLQKPRPPILLGGFTPKTFPRIVNYADGWLGIAGFGPLEQLGQMINGLREEAKKFNKEPSGVSVYILAYPNVLDSHSSSTQTRFPMTGTIEQIGSDIEQIKKMGVKHIVFGYLFSPIGTNMKNMIEVTKQLAMFCR
jgi:probable F420-dependent oxidoreductase